MELIINKRGEVVKVRSLGKNKSKYDEAVISWLKTCTNWTSGVINGKAVNTKLTWQIIR